MTLGFNPNFITLIIALILDQLLIHTEHQFICKTKPAFHCFVRIYHNPLVTIIKILSLL